MAQKINKDQRYILLDTNIISSFSNDNLGEEIWEWRIEGTPPMDETYFMVHFDLGSGGVKKTSKRVVQRG